ncbi:hypothetical protein BH11PSE11_BH11PSE11_05080 [soil metagenome]
MKKLLLVLAASASVLSGCVAYGDPNPYNNQAPYRTDDGRHNRGDRDRDGIPNRVDRDRDGDGVPNRLDRRPDNPNRY